MLAVLHWLYANVLGNLVASAVIGVPAYLWKIRPHIRAQREHREDVTGWIEGLHRRHDELAARLGMTETGGK